VIISVALGLKSGSGFIEMQKLHLDFLNKIDTWYFGRKESKQQEDIYSKQQTEVRAVEIRGAEKKG
jgi:hypothetical protein